MSGLTWVVLTCVVLLATFGGLGYSLWRTFRDDPYEPVPMIPLSPPDAIYPMSPRPSLESEFARYLREHIVLQRALVDLPPRNIRKEPEPMADRITELRLEALESGLPLDPVTLLKEAQGLLSKGPYFVYGGVSYTSGGSNYTLTTDVGLANDLIKLALKSLERSA